MREQRTIFGEVAELYDRARAGYPDALIDDVLAHAGWVAGSRMRALEIGAGTGKATVAFAAHDVDVLALEPNAAMAAVLGRNCRDFPHVRVELATFEDWAASESGFDLLFSAQAWHWVPRDVRRRRASEALRSGGTIALFWHRTDWRREPVRDDLDDVYRSVAPALHEKEPGFPGLAPPRGDPGVAELSGSDSFVDIATRAYPWSASLTTETFVEVALTQSDHRLLDEATRDRLFDAVKGVISSQGGQISVPHLTFLVLARAT